jgi:hypothetical protein
MRIFWQGRRRALAVAIILCVTGFGGQGWAEEAKKKRAPAKPPSVCVGLSESACAGNAICYWRKATTLKSGKTRRAHCRKKPTRTAKPITPT